MKLMRTVAALILLTGFVGVVSGATVTPEFEPEVSYGFTDTIQERNNVSDYNTTTYEDNLTVKSQNLTGWHFEKGANTYLFDVGGVWKDTTSRFKDGSPKDVEVTVELEPNKLTELLQANKEPWKTYKQNGSWDEYFNDNWYYFGGNASESNLSTLAGELDNLPVYENGLQVKTTNLKSKAKNVTAKAKLRDDTRKVTVRIGSGSTVVAVSGGSDDSYDKYKPVDVTSVSGTPTISKAQPVILTCGDDSTTGTGDVVIDCTNVDGVEDIDFSNTTNHRLDYEVESFNLGSGGDAVVWVYSSWVRDGTPQLRVHYGSGSTDEQDVTGTWGNAGQNAVMVQHLQDDPLTATDSTGNNNDGTVTGAVSTSGQFDGAGSFDGTDDKIEFPQFIGQVQDYTFIGWAKPSSDGATVLGQYDGSTDLIQFFIQNDGAVQLRFGHVGGNEINIDNAGSTSTSSYNQLVGTYESSSGDAELFIDAGLTATQTSTIDDFTGVNEMWIGARSDDFLYAEADIDEVRIYTDDKNGAWVQADYDASPKAGQVFFSQQAGTTGNSAPVVDNKNVTPINPVKGDLFDTEINATDADGDTLTYTLSVWENSTNVNNSVSMTTATGNGNDAELLDVVKGDEFNTDYVFQFEVSDGSVTTKENLTRTTAANTQPSVSNLVVSPDPVDAGNTVNGTADVTDSDGNLWGVFADYTLPNGTLIADNVSMNQATGSTYYLSQNIPNSSGSIGTASFDVRAYDTAGATDSSSTTFEVLNSTAKEPKNIVESCPAVPFCWLATGASNFFRQVDAAIKGFTPETVVSPEWDVNATGQVGDSYNVSVIVNSTNPNVAEVESQKLRVDILATDTNTAPTADFSVSTSNLTVDVDASGSSDSDGNIVSYDWDWTSDGTYDDTGVTASHTYGSDGTYNITLNVTDDDGAWSTVTKSVPVSQQTDSGGDGGGGTGDDSDTVSVEGTSARLNAPHFEGRYRGDPDSGITEIFEGGSQTFLVDGTEHTIEVVDIIDSTTADIRVDGGLGTYNEGETLPVEETSSLRLNDVVDNGTAGNVALSIEPAGVLENPSVYFNWNYTINNSATLTVQYRETGYNNQWINASRQVFSSSWQNTFNSTSTGLERGIYETRLRLDKGGNTTTTGRYGFYVGGVSRIEMLYPNSIGEKVFYPSVSVNTFNHRFQVETIESEPANIGAYYVFNNDGSLYLEGKNITTTVQEKDDTVVEDVLNLFKAFAWVSNDPFIGYVGSILDVPEQVILTGETEIVVRSGPGTYTGYANASSTNASNANWTATSIGHPLTWQPNTTKYVDDEVQTINTTTGGTVNQDFQEDTNVSKTVVVNGSAVNFSTPVYWLKSPVDNADIETPDLDDTEITFKFDQDHKGNSSVIEAFVLEKGEQEVYRDRHNPAGLSYQLTVDSNDVTWSEGTYTWHLEYLDDTGVIYSTENKTDGESTFTLTQELGPVTGFRQFFDELKQSMADWLGMNKELVGAILTVLIVVPVYAWTRWATGAHFVGVLAAATTYFALAYVYIAPQNLTLAILLIVLLYMVGKFASWVAGS